MTCTQYARPSIISVLGSKCSIKKGASFLASTVAVRKEDIGVTLV